MELQKLIAELRVCGTRNYNDRERIIQMAVKALELCLADAEGWTDATATPPVGNPSRADFLPRIQVLATVDLPEDYVPEINVSGDLKEATTVIQPQMTVTHWRPHPDGQPTARKLSECQHTRFNFAQHGRCCPDCGTHIVDFGD